MNREEGRGYYGDDVLHLSYVVNCKVTGAYMTCLRRAIFVFRVRYFADCSSNRMKKFFR